MKSCSVRHYHTVSYVDLGPSSLPVVVALLDKDCKQNGSVMIWYDKHGA